MTETEKKDLSESYVAMKEYFESLMDLRFENIDQRFSSSKDAIELARTQMEHRLEGMNQFQKRMDRLEGTFATKVELKGLERLVYIGLGILITVQFVIAIFGDKVFK